MLRSDSTAASPNTGEGQTQPNTCLTRLPETGNAGEGWNVILLQGGMHRLKGGQASNGEEQTLMPFMALRGREVPGPSVGLGRPPTDLDAGDA